MFNKSRGFRLAVDEVEKSLFLADMRVAEKYAELVPDRIDAERIFAVISHEHRRTSRAILELTGEKILCERFQGLWRRFERVRPIVDRANLWQVQLLREARRKAMTAEHAAADDHELRRRRPRLDGLILRIRQLLMSPNELRDRRDFVVRCGWNRELRSFTPLGGHGAGIMPRFSRNVLRLRRSRGKAIQPQQ